MEGDLAIRAAWLHYAGGLTQADVAARLGVSSIKAHRLIAAANRSGAVKVTVEGRAADCAGLGEALMRRHGLAMAEVAPDLGEAGLPLRALGHAGADFLRREVARVGPGVIALGNGRSLAAAVAALPRLPECRARFVSLMGGFNRRFAANPHDVMHRLAAATGAPAYVMPVPFFARSAADRAVLLAQPGVGEVRDLAAGADAMIVGVGTARPDAQLVAAGQVEPAEIAAVRAAGGVGEMLGHFFDAAGRALVTDLSARTVSPDLNALRGRRVIALAGGPEKVAALRAVLASGRLAGLVTDERTAATLLEGA